jgi:hypothetical protein
VGHYGARLAELDRDIFPRQPRVVNDSTGGGSH